MKDERPDSEGVECRGEERSAIGSPATVKLVRQRVPFAGDRQRWVNDVHSQLNLTCVGELLTPYTEDHVQALVRAAKREGRTIAVSGARHAMGGQQFASGEMLIDTRQLSRVLSLDRANGLIEVEAGIQWPELIEACLTKQRGEPAPWTIAQKQTGADSLTLGGSLSANIHGRGLRMKPLISDIESFTLVDAGGGLLRCSRQENPELFALAIGGYGLFGIVTRVQLRLVRRTRVQRLVELISSGELAERLDERIAEGCTYGDFQFSIDERSPDFLRIGVLSCYCPVEEIAPEMPQKDLSSDDWIRLLYLAYTDRAAGFRRYSEHYLSTHGQIYWSDTHQLAPYLPDYAARIRELTSKDQLSSLVITEVYITREALAAFLREAARLLRANGTVLIYGTVRLIEQDKEAFLPWADKPYACVIFNLLTIHTREGLARSAASFRDLIDLAISFGGNFYLTYHKHATPSQVATCYPQFAEFLLLKQKYDPEERFQSDWYRHYRDCILHRG